MTTIHCLDRAKERFGFSARRTERFVMNALQNGKKSEDFHTHREQSWLAHMSQAGCTAIAYNGSCLIVSEQGVCVTLYELPGWFGKPRRGDESNHRIRNAVKYQRMHDSFLIEAC